MIETKDKEMEKWREKKIAMNDSVKQSRVGKKIRMVTAEKESVQWQ